MSTKRATLLTINSIATLSKACTPCSASDSTKTFTSLKHLSTAAERWDFQNANGHQVEVSTEYDQNQYPSGFYNESQDFPVFQQKASLQSSDRPFGAKSHGFYGGNSMEHHQSLNHNNDYKESARNDYTKNPIGQNRIHSGFNGQNDGDFQRSSNGLYHNSGGVLRESTSNANFDNLSGRNGYFGGYHGQSNGVFQHNLSGVHTDSSRASQQRPNDSFQSYSGIYRGSTMNQNSPVQPDGNFSEYYENKNSELRNHNPNVAHGGYDNIQNPHASIQERHREVIQNQYGYNSQGISGFSGSPNKNSGHIQPSLNAYDAMDVRMHQQIPSSGQYLQNPHLGIYKQTSSTLQNPVVNSEVSCDPKPEEELNDASESSPYNGTLEELDGFCKEGKVKEALEVLRLLEKHHVPVDLPRYLQLMWVCGEAKALQEAKVVHEDIIRALSPLQVSTYNKILEMYSKCGSMEDAFVVFNKMPKRNLTSWDIMITWLARNGLGEDAIDLFTQFKEAGHKPDGKLFIGVFNACSVVGDIYEGMLHLSSMKKDFGIVPTMDHYISVVHMFGSVGYLDEALEFIENIPLEPSVVVWETLMNFCRVHGNLELGDRCAEIVEQLDPSHLNEQSKAGLVPVKASDLAKEKEKKAQNLLEVRSRVHEYRAGDTSHPENDKIYAQLRGLREQMKEAGYIPETRFVLHDIDQEGKEDALLAHSERLAVAYGLLNSSARSPIRVIKNLRVCGDCHTALKIISKIVGRELIIRDAKRFHHFKDGLCSCRDYW
uniref:pentatricopeptide repeat-containing protein At4g32450, mitochondrial n=1 Tax=Ziziphus jujuba TaxID=326968 RepID=A0A6P3ZZ04_ZIZJJ